MTKPTPEEDILSQTEIDERVRMVFGAVDDTEYSGEVMTIIFQFLREYADIVTSGKGKDRTCTKQEFEDLLGVYLKEFHNFLHGRDYVRGVRDD